jgi:hypothetical protein
MHACICIDAVASLSVGISAALGLDCLDIDNDLLTSVIHFYGDERRRAQANQVMDTSIEIKWKCLVLRETSLHVDKWHRLFKKIRDLNTVVLCDLPRFGAVSLHTGTVVRDLDTAFYEDGAKTQITQRVREVDDGTAVRDLDTAFYEDGAMTQRVREADNGLLKAWEAARQLHSELRDKPEEQWTEDRLNELVPHWRDHIDAMEASLSALDERVHPSIDSEIVSLSKTYLFPGLANEHLEGIIFYKWPLKMCPMDVSTSKVDRHKLGVAPS